MKVEAQKKYSAWKKTTNVRPILTGPIKDGLFSVPGNAFTATDEIQWAKKRMDSTRVAQYADSRCGLPNTYDPAGAYLCAGREDGASSPCNKREGDECLIRKLKLDNPNFQSCAYWETTNAGDPEARYSPDGKLDDERIGFGDTEHKEGFGCIRCEYFRPMTKPDSEGRTGWCSLKGHTVEEKGCCWDNEPIDSDEEEAA